MKPVEADESFQLIKLIKLNNQIENYWESLNSILQNYFSNCFTDSFFRFEIVLGGGIRFRIAASR